LALALVALSELMKRMVATPLPMLLVNS
jgi:hypothetical protein